MKSVNQFKNELPTLFAGKENLTVVFATYNNVTDFEDGDVVTNKSGLTVRVQNGDLHYEPFAVFAIFAGVGSDDKELTDLGIAMSEQQARTALDAVKSKTKADFDSLKTEPNVLAVVYAGLSAFSESLDYARSLRAEIPTAHVVVLTCDCDCRHKTRVLSHAIENGAINDALMTYECGGRDTMADLLQAVVDAWPHEEAAA